MMSAAMKPFLRISHSAWLSLLVLGSCLGYFLLIAMAPAWLALTLAGWPCSILLALLLFVLFFLITLLHIRAAERKP